jgi:hypothetical protein
MTSQELLPWSRRHMSSCVRTVLCRLPGRACSAVVLARGTYWLLVDPDKSDGVCDQVIQLLG